MPASPEDREYLADLRLTTRTVIEEALGGRRDAVLLGTPRHRNLGDSLIWLGEKSYLRQIGCRVHYEADWSNFHDEDLARAPGNAVVLFQGGGNLGDLWPEEEKFRQYVLERYPRRKFVLLPQSIHFEDDAAARISAEGYSRTRDLTLLLREQRSLEFANRIFSGTRTAFCPDAALGADFPRRPSGPRQEVPLVLARNDVERSDADAGFVAGVDWTTSRSNLLAWIALIRMDAFLTWPSHRLVRASASLRRRLTQGALALNCAGARRQLSPYPAIATNRLHAHVLATLLGIPNFVADNRYGKISGVLAYTGPFSTSFPCRSIGEATERAREFVAGRGGG